MDDGGESCPWLAEADGCTEEMLRDEIQLLEERWFPAESRGTDVEWVFDALGVRQEDAGVVPGPGSGGPRNGGASNSNAAAADEGEAMEVEAGRAHEHVNATTLLQAQTARESESWRVFAMLDAVNTTNDLSVAARKELSYRLSRVNRQIYYGTVLAKTFACLSFGHVPSEAFDSSSVTELDSELQNSYFRLQGDMSEEQLKAQQKLILYLLRQSAVRKLRKKGDKLYHQRTLASGQKCCAWREYLPVDTFVKNMCKKETKFDYWKDLTSTAPMESNVCEYLVGCVDPELPYLVRDKTRPLYCFANGTYQCETGRFYMYGDEPFGDEQVAVKYLPQEMPEDAAEWPSFADEPDWDWFNEIETPVMEQLLQTQYSRRRREGDEDGDDEDGDDEERSDEEWAEVRRWMYVFLGRLMYPVNTFDNWQVMFFMKGVAGSGKSTICKIATDFYAREDVAVLSNNIEKKFGLGAMLDADLVVCLEAKQDLGLDQAELQSMVSGEEMSIPIKFKAAETRVWSAPLVMAGNELPAWADRQGAMVRRVVNFAFPYKPTNSDPTLMRKLRAEMPAIIAKCNWAYRACAAQHSDRNLWTVLPQYFKDTAEEFRNQTNSLVAFLRDGGLRFGEDLYCPVNGFIGRLNEFIGMRNFSTQSWTQDFYYSTFCEYGLQVLNDEREWPVGEGVTVNGGWVVGATFA